MCIPHARTNHRAVRLPGDGASGARRRQAGAAPTAAWLLCTECCVQSAAFHQPKFCCLSAVSKFCSYVLILGHFASIRPLAACPPSTHTPPDPPPDATEGLLLPRLVAKRHAGVSLFCSALRWQCRCSLAPALTHAPLTSCRCRAFSPMGGAQWASLGYRTLASIINCNATIQGSCSACVACNVLPPPLTLPPLAALTPHFLCLQARPKSPRCCLTLTVSI